MRTPELLQLISLLSKSEMQRAEQFLQSPYHNNSALILKLFQYIKKYHGKLDSYRMHPEHVFDHIYPGEEFDERRLKNPKSLLKKLLEEFLRIEQLKKESAVQNRLLVNACYERYDYEAMAKIIDSCITELEKKNVRDARYYQEMLWLREELYYHPGKGKYNTDDHFLSELSELLDHFYALAKYRFITDHHVRKAVINNDPEETVSIHFDEADCKKLSENNELTKLYSQLNAFQKQELHHEGLTKAIASLRQLFHNVGLKEKSFLLNCFINSTSIRYHRGEKIFQSTMLELYRLADAQGLLLYRGKMPVSTFLNIVSFFTGAKALEWSKDFIERYKDTLHPDEKEDALNLAWGYWYFHSRKGEPGRKSCLELSQQHLAQVTYSDLSINLRLRSLLLRIFFELELQLHGNDDVLFDFANAFEKWLIRNKVLSPKRELGYLNFIRFTRRLGKVYHKGLIDDQQLQKLIAEIEIEKEEQLVLKDWLMEKAEEFEELLRP